MIEPPTNCPICDSELEWRKDQLYCVNPFCDAKQSKAVEHFTKTLKIKGLGPATISKLGLLNIEDIYSLDLEELKSRLGSEKIAIKLFTEIERSKKQPLNNILPALGIPLIGKSATNKLSIVCSHITDITEETCKEAGLGEKATSNLITALYSNEYYLHLPFNFIFEQPSLAKGGTIKGTVCISGKLNSYPTKQIATDELERLGFNVKSSITKDVTILINESGKETQKTQKAREAGILIIENLKEFIGDNK